MTRVIALAAPAALALFDATFPESFHADGRHRPMAATERSDQEQCSNARLAPAHSRAGRTADRVHYCFRADPGAQAPGPGAATRANRLLRAGLPIRA
jgi:hypothetical protein